MGDEDEHLLELQAPRAEVVSMSLVVKRGPTRNLRSSYPVPLIVPAMKSTYTG